MSREAHVQFWEGLGVRFPRATRLKKKGTADDDAGRLEKHVYPVIGEIPIDAFTLDHANLVMAGIPTGRAPATRRHVAQLLHRICAMALFPLRVIKTNPLPEGFLPPIPTGKAKSWLYPDEDAKLLCAEPVPLAWRVFYGFLHREGLRFSEAVRLTWADVDLERGVLVLDKNKTEEPRAWALSMGVVVGLRAWRVLRDRDGILVGPNDPVFLNERGKPIREGRAADRYREHLYLARITRGVLFERTTTRQPIRAHDTRATFVTIALANGKSEAGVMDRTGHKSSLMINKYRRAARTAAELALGNLGPLYQAIPELRRLVPEKATIKATPSPITTLLGLLNPQAFQGGSPSRTRTGTSSRTRDLKPGGRTLQPANGIKHGLSENGSPSIATPTGVSRPLSGDSNLENRRESSNVCDSCDSRVSRLARRDELVAMLMRVQMAAIEMGDGEAAGVVHEAVGRLMKH